tara:strand:+ start:2733 stop:3047 length:315 start_codon:yes stop_codon:yes gene_type:complete
MSFTPEQRQQLRNAIEDPRTDFVFIPSAELKRRIATGNDPRLSKLASKLIVTILELSSDQGILLGKDLVLKYVEGSVDDNHQYILGLGEIRVIDAIPQVETGDK